MEIPLSIKNLTKVYRLGRGRQKTAVHDLSMEVPSGVIFGFLGPNGAGKTTTIKAALDFIRPTQGTAAIFGRPAGEAAARAAVGYLPEQPYFHRFLRPVEVVSMHAALAGIARAEIKQRALRALERAGIPEYADTPISKLSKGLTQRVGIAQAIVGEPELLILDEPTSGLDPIGRRHIRDLLLELKAEGKTVFLSSHLLSEVENLCDIVAVLKSGELVACGPPEKIRSGSSFVRVTTVPIDDVAAGTLRFVSVQVEPHGEGTLLKTAPENVYNLMRAMEALSLPIHHIETERESLEEAFLRLAA